MATEDSNMLSYFWQSLIRRKRNDFVESQLARVLTLFDLASLGVGTTLGLGAYVLAGSVAKNLAGPAVTVSFVIAAVASAFSGVCYAEFAGRVPRAGSAYVYSYVTVGEFVAYTIGWNLILEYVIGASSVARGLSGYLDALFDYKMSAALTDLMPINVQFLGKYPDFLSFLLVLLVSAWLAYGVKESSWLNKVLTSVNMVTIVVILVAAGLKADPANWSIPKDQVPANATGKEGGFMPFGISGVMKGAAKCFFGFVGFDCVATCGEEAINPQRNIPLSIVISLMVIFFLYFSLSTVLTMAMPYYALSETAPFVEVFAHLGWTEVKWIVTIGAIFALSTSLLGALFPLPRVLYAMSSDGVLYKRLGAINRRTQTPVLAMALAGLLSATLALIFDLNQLIEMLSIGTLMAYTIVSLSVLILRYQTTTTTDGQPNAELTDQSLFANFFNSSSSNVITKLTSKIALYSLAAFILVTVVFCILVDIVQETGSSTMSLNIGMGFAGFGLLLLMLIIGRQPQIVEVRTFKVPLVPLIPCLSVLFNVYLMFQLSAHTWIRFCVWATIGYFIYFSYGIRNSVEGAQQKLERESERHLENQSHGSSCESNLSED